ncbi:hypothetical protein Y032_0212g2264 [Ancylostoma ceylanicum]|uniref:Uncharacterized protein n=1 Tax=Ancylostoma ceylanicum TaxID=53326 RepID=A0A016SK10_9BILA|nr:hypothetical protein Y032_0212g2264 [Ancylostoma ceylanicum]
MHFQRSLLVRGDCASCKELSKGQNSARNNLFHFFHSVFESSSGTFIMRTLKCVYSLLIFSPSYAPSYFTCLQLLNLSKPLTLHSPLSEKEQVLRETKEFALTKSTSDNHLPGILGVPLKF